MGGSKPIGVTLIGAIMLGFAAVSTLVAILLAAGNALVFDESQPTWVLLAGLIVAYLAITIGLGLLCEPAQGRKAGEMATWLGTLIVWLALGAINLLLTEGQDDVSFFWGLIFPVGVFWSAVLAGASLYMRSSSVRSYFRR